MIQIQALKKKFGVTEVLKGLDLQVGSGERIALVGQNGSGKTTLIRCLLGLYQYQGKMRVDGFEPRGQRREMLAGVGFVPQLPPAFGLSGEDYLDLITSTCRVPRESVVHHAEELGLDVEAIQKRPFTALSGGMKQKLLISAAIARRPRLLVMDEPGANLDPQARQTLFSQLARLPSETTMLLSSHRVDELAGLVTRVIELDAGQIVLDDVVANAGRSEDLGARCQAWLELVETPDAIRKTLTHLGFEPVDGGWRGTVAAPDRFRFLALMTRWSGLVKRFSLDEANPSGTPSDFHVPSSDPGDP